MTTSNDPAMDYLQQMYEKAQNTRRACVKMSQETFNMYLAMKPKPKFCENTHTIKWEDHIAGIPVLFDETVPPGIIFVGDLKDEYKEMLNVN